MKYVENIIKNIPNNKAAGGEIPQSGFTYQMLTEYINDALFQFIKRTKLLIKKIIGQ